MLPVRGMDRGADIRSVKDDRTPAMVAEIWPAWVASYYTVSNNPGRKERNMFDSLSNYQK